MLIDLHNHTPLCNHSIGEPYNFALRAIEKNISVFGFSDHAPMEFDEGYRMSFEQMRGYEKEVLELNRIAVIRLKYIFFIYEFN